MHATGLRMLEEYRTESGNLTQGFEGRLLGVRHEEDVQCGRHQPDG